MNQLNFEYKVRNRFFNEAFCQTGCVNQTYCNTSFQFFKDHNVAACSFQLFIIDVKGALKMFVTIRYNLFIYFYEQQTKTREVRTKKTTFLLRNSLKHDFYLPPLINKQWSANIRKYGKGVLNCCLIKFDALTQTTLRLYKKKILKS